LSRDPSPTNAEDAGLLSAPWATDSNEANDNILIYYQNVKGMRGGEDKIRIHIMTNARKKNKPTYWLKCILKEIFKYLLKGQIMIQTNNQNRGQKEEWQ